MDQTPETVPETVIGNIDTVLAMEEQAERDRTPLARFSHLVGEFVGSVAFAVIHLAVFAVWLLLNSGIWHRTVFDPFPFSFLGTIVSCESVVLTTFVLIKQNRESERTEKRSHLDLQVNLLTEREVTKTLQLLQQVSERLGAQTGHDDELGEMMANTAVRRMAEHLEDRSAEGKDGT